MGAFTPMDATTLERVKAMLSIPSSDTEHDDLIGEIISAVSERIEHYISRPLKTQAITEEYDVNPMQPTLHLRAYPVTSISAIRVSETGSWTTTPPISSALYRVNTRTGEVYFREPIYTGPNEPGFKDDYPIQLQIVYTAGIAVDTATLISTAPSIALAADLWTVAIWRRRDSPDVTVKRVGADSFSRESELRMPGDVMQALWPWRRMRVGA